jgi:serine/threonine protein kinase
MRTNRMSFGKYQVLARLGQGGMGHVYLAMNAGPGGVQKLVVIKQLREDFATSVAARSMFLEEARISMRLNHPNIVQVNEVVDDEDDLYLVMEFLDGQPLSRILDPSHTGAFPLGTKLRILVEALEGLHHAHELTDYDGSSMNVVHRDVSPQNIIVTYDGHVKLVDFGVAKAADGKTVTESGVFKGKIRYSSPEQALCTKVDRRADVFALGTVLWEVLAGRRLWQDQADATVLLSLASGNVPKLRDAIPDVPPALEAICAKALATDLSVRYPTALALRDALGEYLAGESKAIDIGRALSASFDAERRRLHAVIDAQLKAARETSHGALTVRNIPLLGPDSGGTLPSASHSASLSNSEKSIVRGGLSIESEARSRKAVGGEAASHGKSIALAALVVLAIIGGIGYLVPAKAPPKESTAAAAPVAPPVARVHLSLRATPPDARFMLDGRLLATNPYEEDVARDDGPHRLSIRADGFETRDMDARLNRDVSVDVTLAPRAAASAAAPVPAAAPAPVFPAGVPDRRPARSPASTKGSPQRRIDEDDPYKP